MIQDFRDRVAVVTGAASGLGSALARGLAGEGMRVLAADIDADGARATAEAMGAGAIGLQVDVADAGSVAALADAAFERLGQVDLLMNNAGVFQGGLCWERSVDDWQWVMGVNVYGIIHGIRSFVPRMIAQGSDGHVVNTASVAAFVGGPASGPYVVSKCAALSLTECLAHDLAATGARIGASVLTPSAFDTGIAHTASVRPERYGRDETPDGRGTVDALAKLTGAGMSPEKVVEPVLEGVRSGQFLIPTRPSYAEQIRSRHEALLRRELPPVVDVD